uniref:Uncharacterized protein n=1 Tax=Mycena chlorophos TaxID=658473 RepID=A0ABQ0LSZ8_MYCCL|nr:predicted protein [Mycena chlorophos]
MSAAALEADTGARAVRPTSRAFLSIVSSFVSSTKTGMSRSSSRSSSPTIDAPWARAKSEYASSTENVSCWDCILRFFGRLSCTNADVID